MKCKLINENDKISLKYSRRPLMIADCELSKFAFYLYKLRNDSWANNDFIRFESNYLLCSLNKEVVRIIKD